MVSNKVQPSQQMNKMDKYAVQGQTGGPVEPDNAEGGQEKDQDHWGKPSLGAIMAAIQDLRGSLEPKLDAVTVDVMPLDPTAISNMKIHVMLQERVIGAVTRLGGEGLTHGRTDGLHP
ncbi:hypothetical protein NDU88_003700 [Pleurodeles waltl]|uniref:Uncharacterized protein n=1 Tax=Pleurodeles waltl TaxID=8319 RepID=A0AAV7M4U2_PLEWA|nr:hypothetical protein NDU88_003700 [Pleurodeles waltl]